MISIDKIIQIIFRNIFQFTFSIDTNKNLLFFIESLHKWFIFKLSLEMFPPVSKHVRANFAKFLLALLITDSVMLSKNNSDWLRVRTLMTNSIWYHPLKFFVLLCNLHNGTEKYIWTQEICIASITYHNNSHLKLWTFLYRVINYCYVW